MCWFGVEASAPRGDDGTPDGPGGSVSSPVQGCTPLTQHLQHVANLLQHASGHAGGAAQHEAEAPQALVPPHGHVDGGRDSKAKHKVLELVDCKPRVLVRCRQLCCRRCRVGGTERL